MYVVSYKVRWYVHIYIYITLYITLWFVPMVRACTIAISMNVVGAGTLG